MLRPKPFFAGLIFGLAALSVAGATVRPRHFVSHFERLHAGLNFLNFFPTPRELLDVAHLVPDEKIIVIVGGTSVFQGAVQAKDYVWTKYLQKSLGDQYAVINFAQRAGAPTDSGNAVAETLLKEHRRVIFLCDAGVAEFVRPMHMSQYPQVMLEAWERGYLIPWAPRDKSLMPAFWSPYSKLREAAWGGLIDCLLNFRDLWNDFSYEVAGTVWNSAAATTSFNSMQSAQDPEMPAEWVTARGYPSGEADDRDMYIAKYLLSPPDSPRWGQIRIDAEEQYPPQLRAISIINVDLMSPYFVDRIPNGQRDFLVQAQHMGDLLKGIGFSDTFVAQQGFTAADYGDRVHLAVSGGIKLAAAIAPHVQAEAIALGYIR